MACQTVKKKNSKLEDRAVETIENKIYIKIKKDVGHW